MTPREDLAGYLTRYPYEMGVTDEEPAAVFDRYHAEDLVMVNDGVRLDRARLLAHARPVRKRVVDVHVDVHEAMVSGDRAAARYTMTAVLRGSGPIITEVHMFGHLTPDGRLTRMDQLTRDVSPTPVS